MMNWKKIYLYGGLTLAMLFWAFAFIWYKKAYLFIQPMALVFFRLVVASIFISIIIFSTRRFQKIRKKDFKLFLLLVLLEPLLFFIGESYGMKMVTPTMGAIIIAFIPLLTPFLAFWLFREKLTWLNYFGIILSFSGVLLVLIGKGFILNAPIKGVALIFMAVICAVLYSGIIFFLAKDYKLLTIIWVQSIAGMILFLPLFLIFDLKETMEISWSWEAISPIIKLGIFPSVLSYLFYNFAITKIGINKANVFTNFIPVMTAILSVVILNEEMPIIKILGILLVIVGILISQGKNKIIPESKH